MRAAALTANGVIEIRDYPVPSIKDDEVLVKVSSAGICNSDIFRAFAMGAYGYPLVMGHEVSGEIVDAGPKVKSFSRGEKVVVFPLVPCRKCDSCRRKRWTHCRSYDYFGSRRDGGFQEYLAVGEWNLLPIPGGVDPSYACLCEPVAVSVSAVGKVPAPRSGAKAAVIGAGLIGLSAAKLLQDKGYEPSVIDRNLFKLELAREMGLGTISVEEVLSSQDRFPLVLEATGAVNMFLQSIRLAQPSGVVVWVGNIQGNIEIDQKEVSSILRKELTIRGVWNSNYQQGRGDDWGEALRVIGENPWINRVVTHRITLEELPSMLGDLYGLKTDPRHHEIIKVVVEL